MEDRWLSVDEIATYLGVVKESVYRWVVHRDMPGHKVGRHWKFRKEEVDAWVRSGGAKGGTASTESVAKRRDRSM
ncbi:MAG: helix-turn-helix domain-containing protein [Armatimonadetes bacterium]|nr:helix-turn-helix domain-containing protein [Armatimonadota bacterium]